MENMDTNMFVHKVKTDLMQKLLSFVDQND